MGYTHYWTFNKPKTIKGKHQDIETKYQLAMRQCQRIVKAYNKAVKSIDPKHVGRLSGYSVHTRVADYLGLEVNGTAEMSHETFSFRDHWSANESFNFCKTNQKPYDIVVTACLITIQHYLGDLFQVDSDGNANDFVDGLKLARKALNIKGLIIPETIRRELKAV